MHPMLNIAIKAARAAGDIIARNIDRVERLDVQSKGKNDFVTEVDRAAEHAIIRIIRRAYPQHGVLAEETGIHGGDEYLWVIDPLDGTTNFLHGFPQFAVSVALKHRGVLQQAVVYDPIKQELFAASRGRGATLNNRRIRVSSQSHAGSALLGTGIPYRENQNIDLYLEILRAFVVDTAGVRRAGSAALDLAYVAAGRLDGFWEFGLKEWDVAAGELLIQEAGGFLSDFGGRHGYQTSGEVLAGNPRIFAAMLDTIKRVQTVHTTAET